MTRSCLLILAVLFPVSLLALQGCASAPGNYPAQWPERVITSKQGCPDISGTYNNPDNGRNPAYLYDSITNAGIIFGTHECIDCKVILGWTDPEQNQLSVTLQDATGSTLETTLLEQDRDEFSCTEGAILIKYLAAAEFVIAGGIRSGTRKYYLAEDGSLILDDHFSAVGHYFYIPLANKTIDYVRWLRADAGGLKRAADHEARNHASSWELFKSNDSRGEPDFRTLCTAADQGDSRARRELGYLHYHGLYGVRKDPVLSAMWYGLIESYSQGPDNFNTGREQLTPEQQTELVNLYINWKPGHCERELSGIESGKTNQGISD